MKVFELLQDFGFIAAGRLLKEDINGNFVLSVTDEEVIEDNLPWIGSVRLRRDYVSSLPADILKPVHDWIVVSTIMSERAIMVYSQNFGITGLVRNPSLEEWKQAYHAPSDPYPWTDASRVEVPA